MPVTDITSKLNDGKMRITFYEKDIKLIEVDGYDFGFHVSDPSFFFVAQDKEKDGLNNVMVRLNGVTLIKTSKV